MADDSELEDEDDTVIGAARYAARGHLKRKGRRELDRRPAPDRMSLKDWAGWSIANLLPPAVALAVFYSAFNVLEYKVETLMEDVRHEEEKRDATHAAMWRAINQR